MKVPFIININGKSWFHHIRATVGTLNNAKIHNSLALENSSFWPQADYYWNARGGSYTDGGAFIFSVQPENLFRGIYVRNYVHIIISEIKAIFLGLIILSGQLWPHMKTCGWNL